MYRSTNDRRGLVVLTNGELFTDRGNGAVVVRDGTPVGVITRSDLLEFLAHQQTKAGGGAR